MNFQVFWSHFHAKIHFWRRRTIQSTWIKKYPLNRKWAPKIWINANMGRARPMTKSISPSPHTTFSFPKQCGSRSQHRIKPCWAVVFILLTFRDARLTPGGNMGASFAGCQYMTMGQAKYLFYSDQAFPTTRQRRFFVVLFVQHVLLVLLCSELLNILSEYRFPRSSFFEEGSSSDLGWWCWRLGFHSRSFSCFYLVSL